MRSSFLHNPGGVGDFCHCSSLYLFENILHLIWYAYPDEETNQASLVYTRKNLSTGSDWEKPRILLSANSSLGNSWLYCDESGRLVVFYVLLQGSHWSDAIIMVTMSHDGGWSWQPSSQASFQTGLMIRHPPIRWRDQSLWVPTYDEKSYTASIHRCFPPDYRLTEIFRFDHARQIQPCLLNSQDVLLVTFRPVDHPRSIHVARSGNGQDWSNIFNIGLPTALSGHASFIWQDKLGVVLNHTTEHQRFPLTLSVSPLSNLGQHSNFDIDQVKLELSYPSVAVDKQGGLHITYSYNRRMIKYCYLSLDEWMGATT